MAVKLTLPKLGMTMESAKIKEWVKNDGELVEKGEIILIVETDKVVYEVEVPSDGILRILVQLEDEVPVGATLAHIAADKAEYDALLAGKEVATTAASTREMPPEPTAKTAGAVGSSAGPAEKIRIAPAARRIAEEKGIDIGQIRGTGPGGRITKDDVLNFEKQAASDGALAAPSEAPAGDRVRIIKHTEHRKIIARKMMETVNETAQTTHSNDVDATALDELKNELRQKVEAEEKVRITITDVLMKLVACALKEHPIMNSSYRDDADIIYEDIHMGMAMSTKEGELLVTVIRDMEKKSIPDIAKARADYLVRAQKGKLTPDDIKGSTFTLSALGMFGLERFVALINRPENAILAVGAILDKPWVHNGEIAIRKVMNVTLSYDHRTIYGAEAARFMTTLKAYIEDPKSALS
jgi:pyruvate dehydrogenase E2 component (dihydrolipoamide acetyltransferase)